jgi:hypothetical protein
LENLDKIPKPFGFKVAVFRHQFLEGEGCMVQGGCYYRRIGYRLLTGNSGNEFAKGIMSKRIGLSPLALGVIGEVTRL